MKTRAGLSLVWPGVLGRTARRTIRYPDPLIKANDTVKINLETGEVTSETSPSAEDSEEEAPLERKLPKQEVVAPLTWCL